MKRWCQQRETLQNASRWQVRTLRRNPKPAAQRYRSGSELKLLPVATRSQDIHPNVVLAVGVPKRDRFISGIDQIQPELWTEHMKSHAEMPTDRL